ncbi:hypothetical protein MTP99_016165 [Tenebrio molitor]|jgi:hypothetical protein|uniref:uncharacterized protein isoform X2 n=1 Tax=Tenebrio molitor TaxID=7067 RepID=UPI001C3A05FA|nr:hypothetical protein MTP99_016165 [Tenebrio molitor]CAH1374813.1 unnamed protein product [Tenebrio molitor]
MGLSPCTWLVVASVWCINGIYCYNLHRIDDERSQPMNWEMDFSTYETKRFLDDLDKPDDDMFTNVRPVEATKAPANNDSTPLDSWSVVWYVASFGGLIIFFLIVSCSEWCCRRAIRNSQNCNRSAPAPATPTVPDTPPPSYDQFAPPSYESICLGRHERGEEKSKYDIYVVPVHALGHMMETRDDAPPSYFSASGRDFVPAVATVENNRSRVT